MSNDMALTVGAPPLVDLTQIPTVDLKRQLASAIGITAQTLARLAAIWAELEARGEDLSALRGGLMSYLPLIAAGRLDPELVVRCAGQAMLLKAASELTLADQRALLERGAPLVEVNDGAISERRVSVEQLTVHDMRRVFAGDRIRPAAEQVQMIGARPRVQSTRGMIVKVKLTREEYDKVRKLAAERGTHVPTLARQIILDATK